MVVGLGESNIGSSPWQDAKSFAMHLILGRWSMLFASLLILAASGATFMFGLYSNDIKSSLGYDQTTLNLLSFFKDLGTNVGVLSGLINEITPPWAVLSIGAAMNLLGYSMIWLAVTGRTSKPSVWQMCVYTYIGGNSQAFANTGALVTAVKNFPESRGSVLGLLKGFVGLSGAIMTQLYRAIYGDDSKALILLIAWLPAAVSFVFLRTIRVMKVNGKDGKEQKIFYRLLYLSLVLAGFLMFLIIMQSQFRFTRFEYVSGACVELILLFLPIVVVIGEELRIWRNRGLPENQETEQAGLPDRKIKNGTVSCTKDIFNPPERGEDYTNQDQETEPAGSPSRKIKSGTVSCTNDIFNPPERGEDYTILQALFSADMLILFVATTFSAGGTLTAIDNLGQIADSLGYPKRTTTTFVSLVSIWNYLGRVVAGFASEILLKSHKCPRPLLFTLVLLISCSGHLLIASGVPNALYFASVIIGFCYGAQWPLVFAIISEVFGLKYYSTLYNFGTVASPIGAYILNVKLTGPLYDEEARRQMRALGVAGKTGEGLSCAGVECYRVAFLIIAAATFLGCLVSCVLVIRTRKFYRSDIYKKFRDDGRETTMVGV